MIPPTGPDSIIATGTRLAVAGDIVPPLDCMIKQPAGEAELTRASSSRSPRYVLDARTDVGVEHGRRRALVLAVLAQDLVRERTVDARRFASAMISPTATS